MDFGEISLFLLAIVAFSVLCLLVFLSCFKMPRSFGEREQMRRDLRLKIIERNIKMKEQDLDQEEKPENTDKNQTA